MKDFMILLFPGKNETAENPATFLLTGVLFVMAVLCISVMIGRYTADRFGGDRKKTLFLFSGISAAVAVLLYRFFGQSVRTLVGIIFFHLLLTASYSDLKTRECDDWLSVMIVLTGLIGMEPERIPFRIVTMLLVMAIILLPACFSKQGIGGADIKIGAASAFLLGLQKGLLGLTVGLLLAVLINAIRQKDKKEGFPMIPYLAVPFTVAYFL